MPRQQALLKHGKAGNEVNVVDEVEF